MIYGLHTVVAASPSSQHQVLGAGVSHWQVWVTHGLPPEPFKPQLSWAALRDLFQAAWQEPQEERLTVTHLFLPAVISNCSGGKGEGYFSLCEPLHGSTTLDFPLVHFGVKSLPFSTVA